MMEMSKCQVVKFLSGKNDHSMDSPAFINNFWGVTKESVKALAPKGFKEKYNFEKLEKVSFILKLRK